MWYELYYEYVFWIQINFAEATRNARIIHRNELLDCIHTKDTPTIPCICKGMQNSCFKWLEFNPKSWLVEISALRLLFELFTMYKFIYWSM